MIFHPPVTDCRHTNVGQRRPIDSARFGGNLHRGGHPPGRGQLRRPQSVAGLRAK